MPAGGGISYRFLFFLLGNFQTELLHGLARRASLRAQAVDREVIVAPLVMQKKLLVCSCLSVEPVRPVARQLLPDAPAQLCLIRDPGLLQGRLGRKEMFRN